MRCIHCGRERDQPTVGFKAVCEGCGAYLHSCVQCRLYDEAGRCRSTTTDSVRDVEHANFCEEFSPRRDSGSGTRGRVEREDAARNSFDGLFGG